MCKLILCTVSRAMFGLRISEREQFDWKFKNFMVGGSEWLILRIILGLVENKNSIFRAYPPGFWLDIGLI